MIIIIMIQNNKHIRRSRKTFETNKFLYIAVEHRTMNIIEPNLNMYDEDDSLKAKNAKSHRNLLGCLLFHVSNSLVWFLNIISMLLAFAHPFRTRS